MHRKITGFSLREQLNGAMYVSFGQTKLRHHRSRRLNLLLRHASIRFGYMTHDLESDAKKNLLYRCSGCTTATSLRSLHVKQMADESTNEGTCKSSPNYKANQGAN